MPNAVITDTYLTTKPWNYKTHFLPAWKTAIENAGFPNTDIDYYDRQDESIRWNTSNAAYDANGTHSLVGLVKKMVFDNTKTRGTLQFNFSVRRAGSQNASNGIGSNLAAGNADIAPVTSMFAFFGGWDGTNKRPTLTASSDSCLSGYSTNVAGNLSQQTLNALLGCFNGTIDSGGISATTNYPSGTGANIYPLGYSFTPGYAANANITWMGSFYGTYSVNNPLGYTYNMNDFVLFRAINHPEIRGVFTLQPNRAPIFHGYVRPANKPNYWDENTHPYIFLPVTPHFSLFQTFGGSYSPHNFTWATWHPLGTPNLNYTYPNNQTTKRDILAGPTILSADRGAVLGKFSNDLVLVPEQWVTPFDKIVVTPGVEEYLVLANARRILQGMMLAIRVV